MSYDYDEWYPEYEEDDYLDYPGDSYYDCE